MPAALNWHKPLNLFGDSAKPLFQPQLDLKKEEESELLNVTKSSDHDHSSGKTSKLDELNSDEDSGNSSANSSGNEDAKKHLHQVKQSCHMFLIRF